MHTFALTAERLQHYIRGYDQKITITPYHGISAALLCLSSVTRSASSGRPMALKQKDETYFEQCHQMNFILKPLKTIIPRPCKFFNGSPLLGLFHPEVGQLLLYPVQDGCLSHEHVQLDGLVHQQLLKDPKD